VPTITIDRPHHRSQSEAKAMAERLARELEKRLDLAWKWEGDDIHFRRPGVCGSMHVGDTDILLRVQLGLLLAPLKPAIERQMNAELDALDKGTAQA
jgi:putative polyhydroxyalkanoate system protein